MLALAYPEVAKFGHDYDDISNLSIGDGRTDPLSGKLRELRHELGRNWYFSHNIPTLSAPIRESTATRGSGSLYFRIRGGGGPHRDQYRRLIYICGSIESNQRDACAIGLAGSIGPEVEEVSIGKRLRVLSECIEELIVRKEADMVSILSLILSKVSNSLKIRIGIADESK